MLAVGMFSMVAGVFGMNLRTGWESDQQAFRDVCFVSGVASVLVFASVVMYLRAKKLLSM
jgi:magnesium transporter